MRVRRVLLPLLTVVVAVAGVLSATPADAAGQAWVQRAQRALNSHDCLAGSADGRIDEQVRSATIRLQSRVGMAQTGRLTKPVLQRLYADDAPSCADRPVPSGSGKGRRIVISQRQNWVWLVDAKGRVLAQSGMVDNTRVLHPRVSTVGSYCGRAARIKRNTDGHGLWLPNFVRFAACGIGFHQIPVRKSNDRQIHADWLVGTDLRTSHGCIRVPRAFSQRVWTFATRGTPVHVVRG